MRVFELVELRTHCSDDVGMGVAEAGYRRASRCIDILLPVLVANKNALGRYRPWVVVGDVAMQDMSHLWRPLLVGCRQVLKLFVWKESSRFNDFERMI